MDKCVPKNANLLNDLVETYQCICVRGVIAAAEADIRGEEQTSRVMRKWAIRREKHPVFTPSFCIARAEKAETKITKLKALVNSIKDRMCCEEELAREGEIMFDNTPDGNIFSYNDCFELIISMEKRITNLEGFVELLTILSDTSEIVRMKQHIINLKNYVVTSEEYLVFITPLL